MYLKKLLSLSIITLEFSDMTPNYIDELNQSQRDAVLYNDGPSLVIAGAGSGKTRVLTYKIAYLLEQGLAPWNVLALTFTNKAAREMKARIATIVGAERAKYLWMGTFHSLFSRILRTESQALDFSSNFTIYDTSDSRSLIRTIIKEMGLDEKTYKAAEVQSRISNAKNHLVSPSAYAANKSAYESDCAAKIPAVRDIYTRYWHRCRQAEAMDFDDLLFYTFILFRDYPEILQKYQEQFQFVLVDEYQDTNIAQHSVVQQLVKGHQKLCVVGDDAQSIYSFRGADIDNILDFKRYYPTAQVFKLEQNYRSTQNIVAAANSLIKKNVRQIQKDVFSEKKEGNKIKISQAYSDIEEAEIVAKQVKELKLARGYNYQDFAILYRTNAQSRVFEEVFRKRAIPYKIYGGLSFYQRKEIKDIISYFRLVVNPSDEEALKRIINYPARGIGATTLGKIAEAATRTQTSFWNVVSEPLTFGVDINKGTHSKLQNFVELIRSYQDLLYKEDAYKLGIHIVKSSGIFQEVMQDNSPENLSRQENIEELMNGMSEFCNSRMEEGNEEVFLYHYLSEVSLLTDQDDESEEDQNKITLMTVHSAKGLEFPNVFVVGLEEKLFPSNMSGDSPRALEEERRLFYVAITRAEDNCMLSFSKSRMRYGSLEFSPPSRFVSEIDATFVELSSGVAITAQVDRAAETFRKRTFEQRKTNEQGSASSTRQAMIQPTNRPLKRVGALPPSRNQGGTAELAIGQKVEHERFGIGIVENIEGTGDNAKATIAFTNAGTKQLLLRFARFKIVE